MDRRSFLLGVSAFALLPVQPANANPFILIVRLLIGSGERGAATRTVGSMAVRGATVSSQTAIRVNLSVASGRAAAAVANVVPYAAQNPASGAKAIEILTLATTSLSLLQAVAAAPVYAEVQEAAPDSPFTATVAYYALLNQNDREAQLAMWVDPNVEKHFRNVGNIQGYQIDELATEYNDGTSATTIVGVWGKNYGESAKYYRLKIHWVMTDYGWLIAGQESI